MKLIKTVSALLYYKRNPYDVDILLHKHKKLEKYMGGGGHVEEDEHELESLIREIKEETGINLACVLSEKQIDYQRYRIKSPDWVTRIELDDNQHILIDHTYFIEVPEYVRNLEVKCEDGCVFEWVDLSDAIGDRDMFEDTKQQLQEIYDNL